MSETRASSPGGRWPELSVRPVHRSTHPIADHENLYNWDVGHKTVCFPCTVRAREIDPTPLDRFYMYYAPHSGNGIGLATAPHTTGPWTPYAGNPVLSLADTPGFKGHISSPEVKAIDGQIRLYFHGPHDDYPGQHSGVAISHDGGRSFHMHKQSPILIAPSGANWQGYTRSYLRLFHYKGYWYGVYMGHPRPEFAEAIGDPERIQRAGLVRSHDGFTWDPVSIIDGRVTVVPFDEHAPFFGPEPEFGETESVRHAGLHQEGNVVHTFYSSPYATDTQAPDATTDPRWRYLQPESLHYARVTISGGSDAPQIELTKYGPILEPELPWEKGTIRDPFPMVHEGRLYLYYVGGGERGYGVAVYDWQHFITATDGNASQRP